MLVNGWFDGISRLFQLGWTEEQVLEVLGSLIDGWYVGLMGWLMVGLMASLGCSCWSGQRSHI